MATKHCKCGVVCWLCPLWRKREHTQEESLTMLASEGNEGAVLWQAWREAS